MDKAYESALSSNFADCANIGSGGRSAGTVVAAMFLQKFIQPEVSWAHLDIAGTAWQTGKNKGSTGRPVTLLSNWLLDNNS